MAEYFPDANFRNYLLGQKYGKDGILTESEIEEITSLVLLAEGIRNLKGIEYFTSLNYLTCSWNSLGSLDLSQNTNLKELECVHCNLSSLDLSRNNALTKVDCSTNNIKEKEMDKLINSLPYNSKGEANKFYVKRGNQDNNVCARTHVASAKAKGWTPYFYDDSNNWIEYAGSDPTSISNIEVDESKESPIYNLNGQRLDKPHKGINIIGGKKVLVK